MSAMKRKPPGGNVHRRPASEAREARRYGRHPARSPGLLQEPLGAIDYLSCPTRPR